MEKYIGQEYEVAYRSEVKSGKAGTLKSLHSFIDNSDIIFVQVHLL